MGAGIVERSVGDAASFHHGLVSASGRGDRRAVIAALNVDRDAGPAQRTVAELDRIGERLIYAIPSTHGLQAGEAMQHEILAKVHLDLAIVDADGDAAADVFPGRDAAHLGVCRRQVERRVLLGGRRGGNPIVNRIEGLCVSTQIILHHVQQDDGLSSRHDDDHVFGVVENVVLRLRCVGKRCRGAAGTGDLSSHVSPPDCLTTDAPPPVDRLKDQSRPAENCRTPGMPEPGRHQFCQRTCISAPEGPNTDARLRPMEVVAGHRRVVAQMVMAAAKMFAALRSPAPNSVALPVVAGRAYFMQRSY